MSELTGKTIYLVKSEEDDGDSFYTSVLAGFSDEGLAQTYRAKVALTHTSRIYVEPLELDTRMNDEPVYTAWCQFSEDITDLSQAKILAGIEEVGPTLPRPRVVRSISPDTHISITTYAWSEASARQQLHEIFANLRASGELGDD